MTEAVPFRKALPNGTTVAVGLFLVIAGTFWAATLSRVEFSELKVVAALATRDTALSGPVRAALRTLQDDPEDRSAAQTAASVLISEGRDAADTRLVASALGILRPFMSNPDAQTLYLAATARQYLHDFPGALALLDDAHRLDPAHVNTILTRATIQIVQGRFDLASTDCDHLYRLARPEYGFLCQATARLLTAEAPQIYQRIDSLLARPGLLDPALHGWARGLQGEIAMLQGHAATAAGHFSAVVAADPLALRERLLLVDLLLADGKEVEALVALKPAIPADGVLIRRALAAKAVGDTALEQESTAEIGRRVAINLELGLTAHAREEALYFLLVAKDPQKALERAIVNWNLQHEIEDAQLLVDAAMLANKPEAAMPVVRWMAAQSVVVPSFRLPDAVRAATE